MTFDASVIIIDDNEAMRSSLRALLESANYRVKDFPSAVAFLTAYAPEQGDCLVVDIRMPEMSGLDLQEELIRRQIMVPVIVVTGHGDIPLAVRAMKAGVFDFLEKPFDDDVLIASIERAIIGWREKRNMSAESEAAAKMIAQLTERERQVLGQLTLGKSNKLVGAALGISPRTVEIHRTHVQEKLKARGLSDLVRMVQVAGGTL